jgi:DNA-binding NarL/FixJ family response regulator
MLAQPSMPQPKDGEPMITVLIAGRHALFREAIGAALDKEPDLVVVGDAPDGTSALSRAERDNPAVVIVGELEDTDPTQTTYLFSRILPSSRVILLAESDDRSTLAEAAAAGARGILTRGSSLRDLAHAVRAVDRGELIMPDPCASPDDPEPVGHGDEHAHAERRLRRLTGAERRVLALLSLGRTEEAIAHELALDIETTRAHLDRVLTKLGVDSRAEAVRFVTEQHWLLPELTRPEAVRDQT